MKQPEDEIRLRSVLVCSIRNLCIWHSLSDMPVGVPVVTAGFSFGAQSCSPVARTNKTLPPGLTASQSQPNDDFRGYLKVISTLIGVIQ